MIQLWHGDCLEENKKIKSSSVDLILTDLPYGIMQPNHNGKAYKKRYKDNLKWDFAIEPKLIHEIANRILRKNGKMILFSQEPYSSNLITNSISNLPFSYKMIWEKDTFGNHLKCNIAPVGFFEEILIFTKKECKEIKNPLKDIMMKYVNKTSKNFIIDLMEKEGRYSSKLSAKVHAAHKFGFNNGPRFDFLDKKLYEYFSSKIKFDETYDELLLINNEFNKKYPNVFNLENNKKYKSNILKYKKDNKNFHPTQKPILLLEDLIKTFSNKNNLIVDLTMGSGSTGVACKNLNRKFIGIELDENYFRIANERINAN